MLVYAADEVDFVNTCLNISGGKDLPDTQKESDTRGYKTASCRDPATLQ
jgi:hypothetical protein